jgi:hypothetical protein
MTTLVRLTSIALFALVCAGIIAGPAQAMVDPAHLILPGQSVGVVWIGEQIDKAAASWGPPIFQTVVSGIPKYFWVGRIAYVCADLCPPDWRGPTPLQDRIFMLSVVAVDYETPEGIRLGSTLDQVRGVYGKPDDQTVTIASALMWFYHYRGIAFTFRYQHGEYMVSGIDISIPWVPEPRP